jgi:hypothetical protein
MRIALAALSLALASTATLADAVTTRIETRPYYGAVVTIEKGVRVWRPLPAHDRIIINPDGKTPVNINVGDGQRGRTTVNQNSNTIVGN